MEVLVAVLVVVIVIEAMVIYRFKRRADLLQQTMERDRAMFMRGGHPPPASRPPERDRADVGEGDGERD